MTDSRRLLVVDDDPSVREMLAIFAGRLGYDVEAVESGEAALAAFQSDRPDVVTLDVVLPGIGGVETLKSLKAIDPAVPVIMLSGHGRARTIVEAVRNGAADFLRKPFEPDELESALCKALDRAQERSRGLSGELPRDAALEGPEGAPFLLGESAKMREVLRMIDRVADTDITVLIRGESGTGKELVARASCSGSRRAPSRARSGAASASSRRRTAAPSSSTRSARCTPRCRPSCSRCSRTANSRASAVRPTCGSMPEWSPRRTGTSRRWSRRGPSGRTSSTA
jgi:DNA-binding NtrC family response regulator